MRYTFCQLALVLGLIFSLNAQNATVEQTGMMNSKIRQYQEVLNLDASTISSNCQEVQKYYDTAIEAYNFLSTFTIETMEETLQNIGKLRTLGKDLEEETAATFEQMALRKQLEETRNQRKLEELQWRVNWSSTAKSSEVSDEEVTAMKEEISSISGDKQQELDDLIQKKVQEQAELTEQIQLGESSYNKLNADKEDVTAGITVLNDKLESNDQEIKEEFEANSTRGDKLATLLLQLKFFENEKRNAVSFDSIKQLAQLQMRTQDEINQLTQDIETTNNKIIMLQESNVQTNDSLITKKAEIQEISLQMENVNEQLLQIKQQTESITNLIEMKKEEQSVLLSQLVQKNSFIQMRQEMSDKEKELLRAQQKVQEGKNKVERLEREEEMYQQSYMRAQQQTNEIQQKLLTVDDPSEKEQLEEELQKYSSQYQKAWGNYIEKKEELVKEKQLLVTFENFETSIQNDKLKEEKEAIENKKEEQEIREEEIDKKTAELENKLKQKEEEKGEACAINLEPEEQNETENEEEGPLILPTPKPVPVTPQGVLPPPIAITPSILPEPEKIKDSVPVPQEPQPEPLNITNNMTEPEIPQPDEIDKPQPSVEPPNQYQPIERPDIIKQPTQEIIKPALTPQTQEEIARAEENQKKEKIVNEVEELMRKYEELITIKEEHIEERIKVVEEKEQIVIKREVEIIEAAQKIKQDVKKCKEEKREIIVNARQEREGQRSKLAEQLIRSELERLNIQLKEEFKREAEVFKKKKAAEERAQKVREKQAEIDKKVEKIENQMFKDVPKPKKSDKIEVDVGMHRTASPPSDIRVEGSTIPLAYPWQERTFNYTDEVIQPKEEKEITVEEIKIREQEKKAEAQKEVVEEQKEEIQKEEREVQRKEYEILQKQKHFEDKKTEVQKEISKLDEDIARCQFIFGQGDEQSQEYQMCQWQSTDYESKKKQLEQMKIDYERELSEFTKSKEQFFKQSTSSFIETQIDIINEKVQKHLNSLVQLSSHNQQRLKRSIRHKDGMTHLLMTANKISEDLKTVLLTISDNHDELKETLKQVLDEIYTLYETAIIQRNLKQSQNKLLEQKKVLMKMQSACLEAQRILQQ